jgi:ketosteroid isomerase-like protein
VSRQDVEVVKRVLAAGNSGDFETMLALHDPDWEGFIPQEYPVAGAWRGLEGLRGFVEEWLDAWDEFRVEPDEFIDGNDAVVVAVRYWGRGKSSGVEITARWFYAYKLRDGKIIGWRPWPNRSEALKAVGLI